MKKMLLLLAVILASVGFVNASDFGMTSYDVMSVSNSVDGTYSGKATALVMNGSSVSSILQGPYTCTFSIQDEELNGSFNVGPHKITITSKEAITGTGTFEVSGNIAMLITGKNTPFTGTVTVTEVNGVDLTFTANVSTKEGKESVFSFTTK